MSDMCVIGDDLRKSDAIFRHALNAALFQSPGGVLINDHGARALAGPARVFVAWNMQLPSARAVRQALPFLRAAEEVVVGCIDPVMSAHGEKEDPGVNVANWLTHHGCNVTVRQYPSGGNDIADCILDRSREDGADLIVMGAYGHSRAREAVFGGTTRKMIEQADRAVFMAH